MTHTTLKAAALSAAIAFAGFAHAQTDVPPAAPPVDPAPAVDPMAAPPAPPSPAAPAVTEADLESALTAAGYSDVENLDQEGALWTAEATNPQGVAVALRIDAQAGTVQEAPLETEAAE